MGDSAIRELISVLEGTARGTIPRREAVEWARARYPSPVRPSPFAGLPLARIADDAVAALSCAELSTDLDLQAVGDPYFMRVQDFRERSLALQEKNWIGKHPKALRPKRLHQMRPAPFVAARLETTAEFAVSRLGVASLRGVDELDYYEQILFDDRRGRQVFLNWWMREPIRDASLLLELETGGEEVISSLLRLLGCDDQVVLWRPEPSSGAPV
jgi:hypothetical protein